jgi:hypothetical protein
MTLGETLETMASRARRSSSGCPYMTLYASLSKEDQKALDKAWERQMPLSLIVKALRQEGHKTSNDALRAHRKGECKCPK